MDLGILYLCGKDKKQRPIIKLNITKYLAAMDDNTLVINIWLFSYDGLKVDGVGLIEAICYVIHVAKATGFVPGKVECFVFFIDIKGVGLTAPIGMLKPLIPVLEQMFPG